MPDTSFLSFLNQILHKPKLQEVQFFAYQSKEEEEEAIAPIRGGM